MTSSDGSRRLVEITGKIRGNRGNVVRINVAIKRSSDHRICLVGLDYRQLLSLHVAYLANLCLCETEEDELSKTINC